MRPIFVFTGMSPEAGLLLVLVTVAMSGAAWGALLLGIGIFEARARRRVEAAKAFVGRHGVALVPVDGTGGRVRLDSDGGTTTYLRCRTEAGTVERGSRVRIVGYDDGRRTYVVTRAESR